MEDSLATASQPPAEEEASKGSSERNSSRISDKSSNMEQITDSQPQNDSSSPSATKSEEPPPKDSSGHGLAQAFATLGQNPKLGSGQSSRIGSSPMVSMTGSMILPTNMFESRGSIRTWGAEVVDPSIQPYEKGDESIPDPFHVTLPGYSTQKCKYVLQTIEKAPRDPWMGPDISMNPPAWIPQWVKDPNFKAQKYGYDFEEGMSYQMTRLPYVNAEFQPRSAEENDMYGQNYPFAAYPYGVPLC